MQSSGDIVTLNVGGSVFTTSRSTLTREPNSFLAKIFATENQSKIVRDSSGNIFLDRDGTYFRYILNYLRSETALSLPKTNSARNELLIESRYYGLTRLTAALESQSTGDREKRNIASPPASPRDWKSKATAQQETIEVIQQQVSDYAGNRRAVQKAISKATRAGQGFVRVSCGKRRTRIHTLESDWFPQTSCTFVEHNLITSQEKQLQMLRRHSCPSWRRLDTRSFQRKSRSKLKSDGYKSLSKALLAHIQLNGQNLFMWPIGQMIKTEKMYYRQPDGYFLSTLW